jgi:hypothetical protein
VKHVSLARAVACTERAKRYTEDMQPARMFILAGLVLVAVGVLWFLADRLGIGVGRLPGDLVVKRKNFALYVPIVTSLVLSVVVTLLLNLFRK